MGKRMKKMKVHPAAELFPLVEGEEFDRLVADIRERGQEIPIVVTEDEEILDGRNRWRACEEIGVLPDKEIYSGDDPLSYVISLNLHRRHLNESQRDMVGAKLANMGEGRPSNTTPIGAVSQSAAAAMLNVSKRGIQRAIKVINEAETEVIEAVEQGRLAVSQAAQIANKPEEQQRAIVEHINAGEKPVAAVRLVQRETLGDRVSALPEGKRRVIYADPPWKYGDDRAGLAGYSGSAAESKYPTMPLKEICEIDVRSMAADDSILFMWATFPLLPEALQVITAWGFNYKTAFIWAKGRPNMGNYHNASAELLTVSSRGSCTPEIDTRYDQVQAITRQGRHSEKPEEFRALIDSLYPTGPRVELFRRGVAPDGWTVWGNEAGA